MPHPDQLKLVKDFGHKAISFGVAKFGAPGTYALSCSDFKVYRADLSAMKFEPKELYGHESYVTSVTAQGKTLVSGSYDCKLTWFDTEANKVIRSQEAHAKWIRSVVASPDGKHVVSVADDMVAKLWDVNTGKLVHEMRGHAEKTPTGYGSMLYAAAFSPDSKLLATGDKLGKVLVWEVATGKKLYELETPVMYTWDVQARLHSIGGIRSLAFSADGKFLAVGGMGKVGNIDHLEGKTRVEMFDLGDKKKVMEFQSDKYAGLTNHLEFTADGNWLIAVGGAGEGHIIVIDTKTKKANRQEKVAFHVHDFHSDDKNESMLLVGHNKLALYTMKS